jgi:hypothetical protein
MTAPTSAPNGATPRPAPSPTRVLVRAILTHGAATYIAALIAAGQSKTDGKPLKADDVLVAAALWERHIYREVDDHA